MIHYYPGIISPQLEKISATNEVRAFDEISYGSRSFPLYVISPKTIDPALPWVCLTAGTHFGEEPASTLALLELIAEQDEAGPKRYNILALPLVNPSSVGTKGRENLFGQDINRQFNDGRYCQEVGAIKRLFERDGRRFRFCYDMHEDNSFRAPPGAGKDDIPRGVYLYENCRPEISCGRRVLESVKKQEIPITQGPNVYDDGCQEGVILNSYIGRDFSDWMALDEYMMGFSEHTFTAETPTCWSLERRIAAHKEILGCALDYFSKEKYDSRGREDGPACHN